MRTSFIAFILFAAHPSFGQDNNDPPFGDGDTCDIYVANVLTMGCGGEEYRLWPRFHCPVTDYELYVFNRWGEILFKTDDLDEPWDPWTPNNYPGDVYVWRIIYKDMAGEEKELTGHVTILR